MKVQLARIILGAAMIAVSAVPSPALAWGRTGHRVIAAVADQHLSGLARAQVREILGVESLDEAAFWPDEMKSDPSPFWQKTASPWHYVTVGGFTYDQPPPEGDAQTALRKFRAMLQDPATSKADRQLALRFIVHLVADLHQPLHVGRPGDRGGNEVKVTWFGRETNLHAVWDTALVEDEQLSFTEWAERLNRHTSSREIIAWWVVNPLVWITESAQVRETIYPQNPALTYDYGFRHRPVVKRRLAQGGVRLAAYLNQLFDEASAPPPNPR